LVYVFVNKTHGHIVISSGKSCVVVAIAGAFLPSYWFVQWNIQRSQRFKNFSTYNCLLKIQTERQLWFRVHFLSVFCLLQLLREQKQCHMAWAPTCACTTGAEAAVWWIVPRI